MTEMKSHSLFLWAVFVSFATISVYPCTIDIIPLRKQFRNADAVFLGKVSEVSEHHMSSKELPRLPNYWRDNPELISKISFSVEKAWKGVSGRKAEYLGVPVFDCGCPGGKIDEFVIGDEYLVLADEKNFLTVCESAPADREYTRSQIKQLDSFWFRFFARLNPF